MNQEINLPIACDLSKLTPQQHEREKTLLAWFKTMAKNPTETEGGFTFTVDADPETLTALGEFIALERLCCPFLSFHLEVSAAASARLDILGTGSAKQIIVAEFVG